MQLDSASKVPSRNLYLLEQSWHASRGPTKLDWQGGKTDLRLNDWRMADFLARNLHGGLSWRCKTYRCRVYLFLTIPCRLSELLLFSVHHTCPCVMIMLISITAVADLARAFSTSHSFKALHTSRMLYNCNLFAAAL